MSTTPNKTARATSADIARLKVGEKWGAYWKHADGWMRNYPPGGSAPEAQPGDMTDDPEYQAWVESMAKHCRCSHDCPCDGVLAGGICDDRQEHHDDAEEDARNWADDL